MKPRIRILKSVVALFFSLAVTSALSQTIFVWTNSASSNPTNTSAVDLANANNWDPNGLPVYNTGGVGDEMQWDGRTTGDVYVSADTLAAGFSGGAYGLTWHLTGNQTRPVHVFTTIVPNNPGARSKEFIIDSGAGAFHLGFDSATNALDVLMGGTNPQNHGFTNNSTTASVIWPNVRWRMGGGGAHFYMFEGTGDWIVNNRLRSQNGASIVVQKLGIGTMTWTATNTPSSLGNDALGSPITIGGGTMILKSSDCIANQSMVINALLKYDAPVGSASLPGIIFGTGTVQVNTGSLTLANPNSSFSGNFILSGGTLVAGVTETAGGGPLGIGGTISFSGGTLSFSPNNSFDYSSRFDTAAGQAYRFDTAGQTVTFTNSLGSSGATLTKLGNGTLTLAGTSSYSGLTTVSGGTLAFQGPKTGSGSITVNDGATLDVFNSGTQVTPGTLTLGTSAGANLEFDNVASTATAPLAPATIASVGTILVSINSGTFSIGQSYPLLTWTSGSAPAVSLGIVDGAGGSLSTNGTTIRFNCTSVALVWSGVNNGRWDTNTANNWTVEGSSTTYADPKQVVFNDTASGVTNVTISSVVQPESVTINNTTNAYSIASGSGSNIVGAVRFSKRGSGTLTLSGGANANTGVTTLRGGTMIVGALANGGVASDIGAASSAPANLVFNGGALQYTGGAASIDRLFTVGTSGGTIDVEGSGGLTLNNPGAISMAGILTLTGNTADTNTLAGGLLSGGGINKNGTGTWVLTGTNSYGGGTTISAGVLQVGAGGGSGAVGSASIVNNAALDFNRTGTLTVNGAIGGIGSVSQDGSGTVILAANNTYSGGTTVNAGTLQIGNGGASGSLLNVGPIVNNSLLIFNTSGSFEYNAAGLISGTGNVIVRGGGVTKAIGANSYTGWTQIDAGSTFFVSEGQTGTLLSSAVTNNGTLRIVSQDTHFSYPGPIVGSGRVQIGVNNVNAGTSTLTGTNAYSGTFIGGGALVLGDGSTALSGSITGNVSFVNNFTSGDDNPRTLTFNRPDDFTFSNNIVTNFSSVQANLGIVQQNGNGTLTLIGNNTYGGGTVVNFGFLVIGNGGPSGSVGFGTVALNSGNRLVINRSGSLTIGGNISGVADLLIKGSPTVTLNGTNNSYSGSTTVSNGTLIVNGTNITSSTHVYVGGLGGAGTFTGPVTLEPGTTLAPGASIGTLTINSDFTNNASTVVMEINKLASPSNDFVNVTGTMVRNVTGGALTVKNLGPHNLVPGDKFTLFSQPLTNGASMIVTGGRATWVNNLAVDGSISVSTLITTQPTLNFTNTGASLQFSWSDPYNSFKLQAQTNSINVGLSTNWADYPGGGTSPVTVPIVKTNATVFFRIVSIP